MARDGNGRYRFSMRVYVLTRETTKLTSTQGRAHEKAQKSGDDRREIGNKRSVAKPQSHQTVENTCVFVCVCVCVLANVCKVVFVSVIILHTCITALATHRLGISPTACKLSVEFPHLVYVYSGWCASVFRVGRHICQG
jgi:hypothetical protein